MAADIELDAVVIGGGVIGLAVAHALATAGREVTLLEAETTLGMHTSSRNSEVIHAGIYYPPGSLKAELCVRGRDALYRFCEAHEVRHERIGKIIVATREDEISVLEGIARQAALNGVSDLTWLDRYELHELEPQVTAVRGLLSPSTGIVDSHGLMDALRVGAERAGATIVLSSPVLEGSVGESGIELSIGGSDSCRVLCRSVVNSAGLRAQEVARSIGGLPAESIPGQHFARGHYFVLNGRAPFKRLVYPVPAPGGLGVHVTLDLAHQARFGPDVSWIDQVDYDFDETRAAQFYAAIRNYYPALADGALLPGYVGVRPKLGPPGSPAADFVLQGPAEHGVPSLVNLYGIESPGLTASLSIAERVLALLSSGSTHSS
jgi:L-2-hydroxyglutarate oxidase LhgO